MLVYACQKLLKPKGKSYHESIKALKAVEDDLTRLRQALHSLNPELCLVSPTMFDLIDSRHLRALEEQVQTAQKEVAKVLSVRGGQGDLRSRIDGPPKTRFARQCSMVWLLTGNSLDEGKSGELVRFTHLVYEAATGDENGQGLRDRLMSARKDTRNMFACEELNNERLAALNHWLALHERLEDRAPWAAELTLFRAYLSRNRP
jgi:hypothetical protein